MTSICFTGGKKLSNLKFFSLNKTINRKYSPIYIPGGNRQVEKEDRPVQWK